MRCLSCSASEVLYAPPPELAEVRAQAPGPDLLRSAAGEVPATPGRGDPWAAS